ncbi:PTS sugar transporter subunit IIA [Ligilactobacillus sp. WILCCON 0076]|uniref:PTS sugar transporter subunit IIA n=1 Tax=Ligilactobacillus ubinensis TaxID=2876789 RepID=A0A9X2JN74_9LACO|nr:PTS sugar transporter subunit IIA [Ligilactobacillus ubinensis]MCP0888030.1 PTS sugar transporter subunit IIA [Ligilactobacillus ubinensis]
MTINQEFFSEKALLFDQEANNKEEAIKKIAILLLNKKAVIEDFIPAILLREENYPTGLKLSRGVGVAIPHTDADKVIKNQIGFISLKNPVTFRQMGSETETVKVNLIFVLCLKESHEQLEMLQQLMSLFNNEEYIESLLKCKNESEFLDAFKSK